MDQTQQARLLLKKSYKMLVGGEWVDAASGKTFATLDPATESSIAQVPEGDKEDVDRAVRAARQAFEAGPWRKMTPAERGKLIWKVADLFEQKIETFALLESLDQGKTLNQSRYVDLPLSIDIFRYMAGAATKMEGTTIPISVPYAGPARFFAYTQREPVGVVGQIIPWNFPMLMAAWKLAPALAAGCTVVLKPAEQTPLTALHLAELFLEAGFPPGVVNVVTGFGETAGAALAAHPDVDKVAFTGSTEVGKLILKAAAGNLKKVSLELGGKSPNVIFADADLEQAIPGAAGAVFFNAGQCCISGARLYVQKPVYEKVVDALAAHAKKIRLGTPLDPSVEMGPMVSAEQRDRVCSYLQNGADEGARAVAGGTRRAGPGYFVEPTVLVETKQSMRILKEEIFGPVLTISSFDTPEDAMSVVNDTPYGLAAGVWTGSQRTAQRFVDHLKAGTVWVNCYNIFDSALPFGGYKQSGWGRECGKDVLDLYSEVKTVVMPR